MTRRAPLRLVRRSGTTAAMSVAVKPQPAVKHHLPLFRCTLLGLSLTERICAERWGIGHGRVDMPARKRTDHTEIRLSACGGVCEDGRRRWEGR